MNEPRPLIPPQAAARLRSHGKLPFGFGPYTITGSPSETNGLAFQAAWSSSNPLFVQVTPPLDETYTPDVPTPGKNEQSLAGAVKPRTGPGPQGG